MSNILEFVTVDDVAKHLKVSVSTVRAWVRQGHITPNAYIKFGKTYRFNLERVVACLLPTDASQQPEVKQDVAEVLQQPEKEALELSFDADEDI